MIILTSVKGVFNGSHTDPDTGVLHGHDYEVEAGWYGTDKRFEHLKAIVDAELALMDHQPLPAWRAEDIASVLKKRIGCDVLKLDRPTIRHFVMVYDER